MGSIIGNTSLVISEQSSVIDLFLKLTRRNQLQGDKEMEFTYYFLHVSVSKKVLRNNDIVD